MLVSREYYTDCRGGWHETIPHLALARSFCGFEATRLVGSVTKRTIRGMSTTTQGDRRLVGIDGKLVAFPVHEGHFSLDQKWSIVAY